MGVMKVDTGFIRPDPARTLHKHAGENLEALGDPVLKLLQQDAPLADEVVLDLLGHARVGHVGDRQEETDTVRIAVVKLVSVKHETADTLARPLQVHLVAVNLCSTGRDRSEQRIELGYCPFSACEFANRSTDHVCGLELEGPAERIAGRYDGAVAIQKQQRRGRRRDDRQRQVSCRFGARW
jgi:hypothetical protein